MHVLTLTDCLLLDHSSNATQWVILHFLMSPSQHVISLHSCNLSPTEWPHPFLLTSPTEWSHSPPGLSHWVTPHSPPVLSHWVTPCHLKACCASPHSKAHLQLSTYVCMYVCMPVSLGGHMQFSMIPQSVLRLDCFWLTPAPVAPPHKASSKLYEIRVCKCGLSECDALSIVPWS